MGSTLDEIDTELAGWLQQQHVFFVATAPLTADGLVNCSPKGMDTFRILGPHEVAYADLTGSGIETVAHLRENGRIVFMFCALNGPPKIVRLHGMGEVIVPAAPAYQELRSKFPHHPGMRAIIKVNVKRIGLSCGFSIPRYDYVEERDTLTRALKAKSAEDLERYHCEKNNRSLDGLPAL